MRNPTRASVSAELQRLARPVGAFDAARYFRGDHGLRFHNVGTKAVRSLARAIHLANRDAWRVDDAMRLADTLIRDPHLEAKAAGIEVVARYRRSFTPRLLPAWKRWRERLRGQLGDDRCDLQSADRTAAGGLPAAHPADATVGHAPEHVGAAGLGRCAHPGNSPGPSVPAA